MDSSSSESKRVIVLFTRTPEVGMETDLEIMAGEVLTVEDGHDVGDWWYGKNEQGRYGYFPSNFVKELPMRAAFIEEEDGVRDLNQDDSFHVEALYPFHAQTDEDLSFEAGDMIEVRQQDGDWWLGVNLNSLDPNKEGLFPSNYVKVVLETVKKSDTESSTSSSSSSFSSSSSPLASVSEIPSLLRSTPSPNLIVESEDDAFKDHEILNAVTNLDFLFHIEDKKCDFVDNVNNDEITTNTYDDDVDELEIGERLLQQLLQGQKESYEENPQGFVHSKISQQEDRVNGEIIDMLIQWEDTVNQDHQLEGSDKLRDTSGSTVPIKMLQKLDLLDETMNKIEDWLESRVEDLTDVTNELASIEKERKRLEVTTRNLTTLKEDVTNLVESSCLTEEEEKLIQMAPNLVIDALNGSFVDIKNHLNPLTQALEKLFIIRSTHNQVKNDDSNNDSKAMMKHLGGVSLMQQYLARVSIDYLRHMDQVFAMSIYTATLNHKDLILNNTFKLKPLPMKRIVAMDLLVSCNADVEAADGAGNDSLDSLNPLQVAQRAMHEAIKDISSLVGVSMKISPSLSDRMQRDYIKSIRDLYKYMLKEILREIQGFRKCEKIFTMATVPSYTLGGFDQNRPDITLTTSWETSTMTTWARLELYLTVVLPFVEREHVFFKSMFSSELQSVVADDACPGYELYIDYLFSGITKGIKMLVNDGTDGVESLAQYSILDSFCARLGIDIEHNTKSKQSSCNHWFQWNVLRHCKSLVVKRVEGVLNSQLQWLKIQKSNPKQTMITTPFMKFPTLMVCYLQVFVSDIKDSFVDQFYRQLMEGLIDWLETNVVTQNQKYADVLRITNYSYLLDVFQEIKFKQKTPPSIHSHLQSMKERLDESRTHYINWMVAYEFPILTSIFNRFGNLLTNSHNTSLPDLGLFASKEEISSLGISDGELTTKSLQLKLKSMKKRYEKHFDKTIKSLVVGCDHSDIWDLIRKKFLDILHRVHESAQVSFQLSFHKAVESTIVCFGMSMNKIVHPVDSERS